MPRWVLLAVLQNALQAFAAARNALLVPSRVLRAVVENALLALVTVVVADWGLMFVLSLSLEEFWSSLKVIASRKEFWNGWWKDRQKTGPVRAATLFDAVWRPHWRT